MNMKDRWTKTMGHGKKFKYSLLLFGITLFATGSGCGPSAGAWLYTLGMVPKQKVKAEYKLPQGPILILVDDDLDLIQPPLAGKILVDELAKEFKKHDITDHVTTNKEIAKIRQQESNFDQRGAREIGRLADADTVIWISTKQFFVPKELEMTASPAKFTVALKVINSRAETREDVRLWPPYREGKILDVTISPHQIMSWKTHADAHEKLAQAMADKIIKLFHDYEIDPYN
ncbi:MAG: hypothetical protein JSV03_01790 [Planctomycetota bacterium]|nr:MAG: hypothetical protein JSV03_01790 [Planctomycetota bacterium]